MKSVLLLLVNLAMNVSLYAVHPSYLGLLTENPVGSSALWSQVTELWALPFCLLILSFTKDKSVKLMRVGWGGLNAVLGGVLLWEANSGFSHVTWMGIAFLGVGLVMGLSLTLVNLIEINKEAKPKAEIIPISNTSPISKEENTSVQNSSRLPKVEGA
ncbi:MAG: hypothetical protein EB078_02600 [Proteobacteria bacterium]|nr:hypothetical protein [Pseudomonadota bacterium]NDC23630.1 hypothetical protein [Pseudomonadota bacterium]NDD03772.1 hypothetical protein [Pseudomonadota bacterium]NDG26133.1 hypothetical protein [Pseudomonadota bacterium]